LHIINVSLSIMKNLITLKTAKIMKTKIFVLLMTLSSIALSAQENTEPSLGMGGNYGGFTSLKSGSVSNGLYTNLFVNYRFNKFDFSLGYNVTYYNKLIDKKAIFSYSKGYSGAMLGLGYCFYKNESENLMLGAELVGVNAFSNFFKFENCYMDLLLKIHLSDFHWGLGVGYMQNNIKEYFPSQINNMTFSLHMGFYIL
jgi:hypothetical protein